MPQKKGRRRSRRGGKEEERGGKGKQNNLQTASMPKQRKQGRVRPAYNTTGDVISNEWWNKLHTPVVARNGATGRREAAARGAECPAGEPGGRLAPQAAPLSADSRAAPGALTLLETRKNSCLSATACTL